MVAGLLLSASGAISHDLWFNVFRPDASDQEREGTGIARVAALSVGVVAIIGGLVTSVALIVLGPQVWPAGPEVAPFPLTFPALISIPAGFLFCWLGTVFSRRKPEDESTYIELLVRSETGLGAEAPTFH